MAERVRALHRRVRGVLAAPAGRYPAGTRYRADDPQLLMWVLFSLVDSAAVVYGKSLLRDPIREQYGFSPVPPAIVRKALVAGGAAYCKRAVVPLLPERLRLAPAAHAA